MRFVNGVEAEKSLQIWVGKLHIETIPQENIAVYKAIATSIKAGVELEKKLGQKGVFFKDIEKIREFFGTNFFDTEIGVITDLEVMKTTRDGWAALDAPHITCHYTMEGLPEILITANNLAGTNFNDEVVSGLNLIKLSHKGSIRGENIWDSREGERDLTTEELHQLTHVFNRIAWSIQGRLRKENLLKEA